jgi:hypothetical protein
MGGKELSSAPWCKHIRASAVLARVEGWNVAGFVNHLFHKHVDCIAVEPPPAAARVLRVQNS